MTDKDYLLPNTNILFVGTILEDATLDRIVDHISSFSAVPCCCILFGELIVM
jgi:hypothetical protein